jgi:hypothetical protein
VRVLLLTDQPELVELSLEVDGHRVTPLEYPGASLLRGSGSVEFALDRKVLEQDTSGEEPCKPHRKTQPRNPEGRPVPTPLPSKAWHAKLSLSKAARARGSRLNSVPYTLVVFAESDLRFTANVHADSDIVGAHAFLSAWLTEHGAPVTKERVRVWAEVTYPDGGTGTLELGESVAGRFEAQLRCTLPGTYRFRILAAGRTFRGKQFKRELTRTIFIRSAAAQDCRPCAPPCGPHKPRRPEHGWQSEAHDQHEADDDDELPAKARSEMQARAGDGSDQLGRAVLKLVTALRLAKDALR